MLVEETQKVLLKKKPNPLVETYKGKNEGPISSTRL
jgi:hypothetical protein